MLHSMKIDLIDFPLFIEAENKFKTCLESTSTQNIDEIREDVVIIDLDLEKIVEVINHLMFLVFFSYFVLCLISSASFVGNLICTLKENI